MERFRDNAKKAPSTFYLTLVSIIASLAFGYLLSSLQINRLFGHDASLIYWLQSIATLQVIVLTWHEYVMGSIAFRFVINYIDSLIPFCFGILHFSLITSMHQFSEAAWFATMSAFCLLSLAAYYNQNRKARPELENQDIYNGMPQYAAATYSHTGISAVLFAIASVIIYKWIDTVPMLIFFILANIALVTFSAMSYYLWNRLLSFRSNLPPQVAA